MPDLTIAAADTTTLRRLIVRDTRRWAAALRSLKLAHLAAPDRAAYAAAVRAWSALEARAPAQAHAILRMPTLSVLLEVLERGGAAPAATAAHGRELAHLLLLELAVHRALPAGGVVVERGTEPWPLLRSVATRHEMRVADEVERLRLVSGGLAFGGADPAFDTDVVAFSDLVAGRASPRCVATEAYYPITPTLMLATTDNNPLSDFEAHPDKEGNQLDLGGRDVASWTAPLAESVALIERYLPLLAEELRLLLRLVIPVGYDPERHLSASYQEYIGALYMTLHPNTMTMVEALIHEFQHNKLNAACHHDPILDNAFWPLFSSPVRPDPRPLHGVVLAVHAFQPVALLYERMAADSHPWAANPSWQRRAGQVLEKIHDGAGTVLANAAPTAAGRQLLDEMRRLDGELVAMGRARGWIA